MLIYSVGKLTFSTTTQPEEYPMITIVAWKYYGLCVLATIGGTVVVCGIALLILGVIAFSGSDKVSAGYGWQNP